MNNKNKTDGFTPEEHLISIIPSVLTGIIVLLLTVITALIEFPPENRIYKIILILYSTIGSIYLASYYLFFISASKNKLLLVWINAILGGISLGLLSVILPDDMDILLGALMIIAAVSSAIVSERLPAYFITFSVTVITLINRSTLLSNIHEWTKHLGLAIISILAIETIQQLKNLSKNQINRLEIVNEFSKEIASSLETGQVIERLNTAIQDALKADTYYVGMVDGDEIYLHLFYDDGEYFTGIRTNMEGTLSGWVIRNQKGLFLPDLRHEIRLGGVKTVIIGKQKTSLSWMGVPMHGKYVNGIIAIASYHPNAFDRSDMELLSNMTQRAALALDNTFRHALVEEQTHLDSLTGVYNHGYFLKVLQQQAEIALSLNQPLSLIMLDVDYFKQYNDTYGHLAGDEVLTTLCKTIRRHVKRTDAVGRWGGEEFAISLPNTTGLQAMQVADRIRETMANLKIKIQSEITVAVPTVSQGIAIFPEEANETIKLIDLADQRLYIAKDRGRNQVEPEKNHWDKFTTPNIS